MRVDEPREDVFADAAFAADQYASLSRRHAGRDGAKVLDCSAAAHQQGIEGMLGSSRREGPRAASSRNTKPLASGQTNTPHERAGVWEALTDVRG